MKRILLANDDGIYAPGLKTLWQALHRLADITIVAPLSQQSGISLAVTSRSPLELMKVNFEKNANAWTLNGTPADCVKMALSLLFQDPPDLIISRYQRWLKCR